MLERKMKEQKREGVKKERRKRRNGERKKERKPAVRKCTRI